MYSSLVIKKDRAIRNRHPWVFSGAVAKHPAVLEGSIVEVVNTKGERLGYGHYAPNSPIVCRMFHFGDSALTFDNSYWHQKLQAALDYRKQCGMVYEGAGYRLCNAEGDGLPGTIIDVYHDTAVLQLRTHGAKALRDLYIDFLRKELKLSFFFDKDEHTPAWLSEVNPNPCFAENGYRFWADPVEGQKTGFFLDQRDNRAFVGTFAKDRTALNAFGYTGGFAVYLLGAGAKSVVSVDSSAAANDLCDRNIEMNFPAEQRHKTLTQDCFDYLKQMPEDYFDLIILDPPAFTRHIGTVEQAARGYKELNLKAFKKIKRGGFLFTFSCSQPIDTDLFRKIIFGAAADAGRNVRVIRTLGHGLDHPVDIYHPEGDYLKGLALYVE